LKTGYNLKISKIFVLFLVLFFCCNGNNSTSSKKQLPNIILIIGDDHGYPYFGFMGSKYVKTPNMDSLAKNGTVFTNGYVPDNHCRPALKSLITGILPTDYKRIEQKIKSDNMLEDEFLMLSEKEKIKWINNFEYHSLQYFETLPKLLMSKGYNSFQSGKWWEYHHEYGGFIDGMTKGWKREKVDGRNWFQQFMGGKGTDIGRVTNKPVFDFINQNKKDPFFIWYAPQLPHYPFDAPNKYLDLYKNKGFSKSAVQYYANCTWFDDSVGDLVKFLRDNDILNNTLLIYVNDNGWEQEPNQEFIDHPIRSHNGGDKGKLSVYDQSYRTPIIFSWRNKLPFDKRKKDLIHTTDIFATILDLINISPPENIHGISYKEVINDKISNPRNFIVGNSNKIRDISINADPMGKDSENYWVRSGEWFFRNNLTDETQSLFNLREDQFCNTNLAPDMPNITNEMLNKISRWRQERLSD
tara:strand:+ start:340 stop:1746 length:1407 start_codon:yes stop_codon:yes gene_type:complete